MSDKPEITPELLDELDALACAAHEDAPYLWYSCSDAEEEEDSDGEVAVVAIFDDGGIGVALADSPAIADFIAAASPDVVRALVALVRRELAEVARERDALEARLAEAAPAGPEVKP